MPPHVLLLRLPAVWQDPRHPDPAIPAAFVTQRSGVMMRRLMVEGKTVGGIDGCTARDLLTAY